MRIKKQLQDLEKGDGVWCGGDNGFCHDGIEKITEVSFKFDEVTGDKYKVIHLGSKQYDSRNGNPLTPPLAYYIKAI